uniref:Tiorf136 protein n=1 Tax=Agrobacterium tumefaciens TaxID=358 RepID=Q9R6C7_AGRTU|nr:tiorf136 [Agrobacterium tumefaciens]
MISDSCVTPIRVGLICPARQFADGGSSYEKGTRHSASARFKIKALAKRLILAERAPIALAVSRQVAVMVATSLIIARACGSVRARKTPTRLPADRASRCPRRDGCSPSAPEPSDRSERV